MNINEFRKAYPQYNDLSDEQVATKLHKTFYSDMDKKAFDEKLFAGTGSAGKDIVQSVKSGAWGLAALPSNIYGLATGDYEQLGGPAVRQRAAEAAAKHSPLFKYQEREAQAAIEEAQKRGELAGAGEAAKQYLTNPRLLAGAVAEAAPSMVGGLGAGKVAQAGIGALARRGVAAGAEREAALAAANKMAARQGFNVATGTMAAQQGGDVAQQTYDAVLKEAKARGYTSEQAQQIAGAEARKAGLIGAGVSALTMKGLPGFEKTAFTGIGTKGALAGAAKGFAGEATQEALEEGGGQFAQNLALQAVNPEQSLTQGVGSKMAQAGIIGGLMGGPGGALSGRAEGQRLAQEEAHKQFLAKQAADQQELLRMEAEARRMGDLQRANEIRAQVLAEEEAGMPHVVAQTIADKNAQKIAENPAYVDMSELEQDELNQVITQRQETGLHPATGNYFAPQMPKGIITPQYLTSVGVPKSKNAVRNALQGLDLTNPDNVVLARQKLEAIADSKAATAGVAAELLEKNPLFTTVDMARQAQAQENAALAEQARQKRNQNLQSLLANMEAENVAREEADRVAREQAAAAQQEQLARGVTEDITQVPFKPTIPQAQAPEVPEQPSAGVPSEVRAEGTPEGLEPSMGANVEPVVEGAAPDTEPSGRPLGDLGESAGTGVQTAEAPRGALTDAETNRILAGLRKEGLTKEEARQQLAEATPEEIAALQSLYAPTQVTAKTTAEQEADIAEAAQAEGEFGDISARQAGAAPAVGMSIAQTQGIVDELKSGWKRDANIVVKNFSDEDPRRQAAMKSRGLDTAKGYIDHDGTVVVLANNNKDAADVAATLFHEALGHLGLRLKFKNDLNKVLNQIYNTNPDMKQYADKWLEKHKGEYDENLTTEEKRAKGIDEVLAEVSEQGKIKASIWDRLKALVNKYARMAGIKRNFSDAEIRSILAQAQAEVISKEGKAKFKPGTFELAPRAATVTPDALEAQYAKAGRSFEVPVESHPFQEKIDAAKTIAEAPMKYMDKIETMTFSRDAAINNAIRRAVAGDIAQGGQVAADAIAKLYAISTSQALHSEAMASEFLSKGRLEYDAKMGMFKAIDAKDSWEKMVQALGPIAEKYGISFEELQGYAQVAFEARRLEALNKNNEKLTKEAEALEAKGKKQAAENQRKKIVKSHMTPEQIAAGNKYFEMIPELKNIAEMWNGVRQNALDLAVETGLYTREQAEDWLDNVEYVPFHRVAQIEEGRGPKEFTRGLMDAGRDYRLKGMEYDPEFGSHEVNNVFDNMERWTSYLVRRAVENKKAQELVRVAQETLQDAREVPKTRRGMENNTVAVWQDGERKFYEMSDPMFVEAFKGMNPIVLSGFLKSASKFGNALRKNIVLNPLFSISQLPQDAFAAMLTSGLKHPFKLPLETMKEFYKILKGTSEAHKELQAYGAVGHRDFSATVARSDTEIAAGLKNPTGWQKLLSPLEKFSMASDNAVRQAVYNLTMQETGDKAKAITRAFETINFRRKGASPTLALAGQVIPFFNAYLQAQNVAYKVLTGRGISPTARKEARNILAMNVGKIMILSLAYAAVMADDEDYQNTDPTIRDRHWMIPGTGLMIPVRTDLFSMPKVLTEHAYHLLTEQGFEDPTKARRAIKDAFMNAILGPTAVPQIVKPAAEVYLNRNFYTGRPIVGQGLENVATSEQFTASTSELAKTLGAVGPISPLAWDHLIKGYLGTTGGLGLMATDMAVNGASGVARPDKSFRDMLASTPGLSTFVSREFGSAEKTDFYELAKEVNEVNNTFNRLKAQGRGDEIEGYMTEENQRLMSLKKPVADLTKQLGEIRKQKMIIAQSKEMTSEEKGQATRELDEYERELLKGRVRDLRQAAEF